MAFKLKNKGIKKIVGELRKASKLHAGQADKLEKLIRKKTRPQRRPWTLTDIRPQNRPSSVNKNNKK